METRLYPAVLFTLYQVSLLLAIVMLPVALAARRVGVTLPIHRAVDSFGAAYEQTQAGTE